MELFKLFGTIAVKNSQANEAIDETTGKAAQSESKMSSAFKKIGSAFTKAFSNNGKVKETSQSLKQLTETVDKQESVLTQLKNKYRDLYLTHGKNSTEAKECAKEIDRLSSELKENKTKLTEAERAADKFDKTLDDVSDSSNDASNSMSDSFKKIGAAVTAYFAVDKVVDFGKQVVEAAANVSAEASAFEQIMGGYSDTAQKKMNEIADNTGMVASRLTPYMTSMTAKFKGLGFDIGEATDLASDGLNLAADAAAFWDMSLDDSMSHLNSFINGSYEGGEAIGLFANDTQMASYAVSQGLVKQTKDWASLDEATKQATRLEYAQNMMKASGAVGQAAKESSQYANVQANLNEKWRQFKAQIGEPLLENVVNPAMQKLSGLVDKASTGFQDLQKWVSENKTLLSVLGGVIGAVAVGMETFAIKTKIAAIASEMHKAAALKEKLAVLGLNGAMLTSPVTWIVAGIVALIAVFVILWNKCEGFRNFWINLWDKIKTAFAPVIEFVKSSFESFKEKLQTGIVPALQDLWAAIKEKVLPVLSLIWDYVQIYIQPAFEWLKTGLGNIKIVFQTIFTVIKTIVSTAFENIKTVITTVWNNIKIVISTVLDVIKNIIKLATSIIKGDWKGAWEAIKGMFSSIWNGIKGIVSNVWNAIKSIFSNNLNAIKSSVSTVFNGVKAVIQNTINGAKNIVKSGLNAIKNFFSKLKLKFPSIKLPHFSIKGSFSLKPPSVPKLSVDWYAKAMKNAMLLNQPTIFGVNPNGNLMGGGEAGQEVVAGSSTLMAMIRNAVQNENAGIIYYLDKLISMLAQYFPEILGNLEREMVLDDGTLVAKITPKVDKKLGDINRMKERGQ